MGPQPMATTVIQVVITIFNHCREGIGQKITHILASFYLCFICVLTAVYLGTIIFFKVRERVKKAIFNGRDLDDLNNAFLEKFPDFPRYNNLLFSSKC